MTSNTPTYVFVVVISTDERKNGGTEMVDTCGVYESVDDANDEAKSLLAEQYDGHIDAGFIERWTDDDNNTITYDYAGCLKMFDYPEEVCNMGFESPFKVNINMHEVQRSKKSLSGMEGQEVVEEEQPKTTAGCESPPVDNKDRGPPASKQTYSKKRSIDDVAAASKPRPKRNPNLASSTH